MFLLSSLSGTHSLSDTHTHKRKHTRMSKQKTYHTLCTCNQNTDVLPLKQTENSPPANYTLNCLTNGTRSTMHAVVARQRGCVCTSVDNFFLNGIPDMSLHWWRPLPSKLWSSPQAFRNNVAWNNIFCFYFISFLHARVMLNRNRLSVSHSHIPSQWSLS